MGEKTMTDNDIIKALECCTEEIANCDICPYDDYCSIHSEEHNVLKDALVLINRQKAEIEEQDQAIINALKRMGEIRAEAITEFAERLKATPKRFRVEYVEYFDRPSIEKLVLFIDDNDIDQIAKEMKEGVNNA
jgi:hypothetical protein